MPSPRIITLARAQLSAPTTMRPYRSTDHDIERKLPSQILDALAEVGHLNVREQVVGHRDQAGGHLPARLMGQPAFTQPTEPGRLALASARLSLLAEIVDSLMQGTQFIALTGPGVGKTIMASAIHEELSKRLSGSVGSMAAGAVAFTCGRSCSNF